MNTAQPTAQPMMANAYPRKHFFIQIFTRDIGLEECLLDLVDNSLDGLIRSGRLKVEDITRAIFKRRMVAKRAKRLPLVSIDLSPNKVTRMSLS